MAWRRRTLLVALVCCIASGTAWCGNMRAPGDMFAGHRREKSVPRPTHRHERFEGPDENLLAWGGGKAIRFFQLVMTRGDGDRCRFTPSCSEFGRLALKRRGFFLGSLMTADRLLRDHPYDDSAYPTVLAGGHRLLLFDPVTLHDFWLPTPEKRP